MLLRVMRSRHACFLRTAPGNGQGREHGAEQGAGASASAGAISLGNAGIERATGALKLHRRTLVQNVWTDKGKRQGGCSMGAGGIRGRGRTDGRTLRLGSFV